MKTIKSIKTVDLTTLEWFDKVNGNSYFCSRIVVNYGMKDESVFIDSFKYGYGSQSEWTCMYLLKKYYDGLPDVIWRLKESGIIIRISRRYALKRELKQLESQTR